jgi:hypothetical protein
MQLDIRIPIGLLFGIIGAILVVVGLVTLSQPEMYARSADINVNLGWGGVLLVFSAFMLLLARRAAKLEAAAASNKTT